MKALRLFFCLVSVAALNVCAASGDKAVDASPKRVFLPKHWDLLPFRLEKKVDCKLSSEEDEEGLVLDEKPVQKTDGTNGFGPKLELPKALPSAWGKWHFWNGQWWATDMMQKESAGPSWEAPAGGFRHATSAYNNLWLRARVAVPTGWEGGRLEFEQTEIRECNILLFVNGRRVGVIRPPAGRLDVSAFVKPGENEFLMMLTSVGYQIPDPANPARGLYVDEVKHRPFRLMGDPPSFIVMPPVCIVDVFANTSWRQHRLTAETTVDVSRPCAAQFASEVIDGEGKTVKTVTGDFQLKSGENVLKPFVEWNDPITWELGRGYRYTLRTRLSVNGKTYTCRDVKFGFREVWREGRKIFMNGHEQKFRVTYNFGCNKYGAKLLTGIGYNTIQYAHFTSPDPNLREEDLEYLSANGIAAIMPTSAFDWNTKNALLKPGEAREKFKRQQARNLRRYRNWPCIVMLYMGVNTYLPQWAYEALHLGSGDGSDFAKMMEDVVAAAKKTNPNVLYYTHSDGNTGEIASANLYFNWVPMSEREDWPSRWAERGNFPFQAAEFGHPYQASWYKGDRDLVTEYCAIYYGDRAYETEPLCLARNHRTGVWLGGRVQHPMTRELQSDFTWRVNRAWRTYGINAGVVWFNLDTGFGMPGYTMEKLWNDYKGAAYNFFKSEDDLPKGRPAWALPYWDIYRRGNQDFLGWIAGARRITDRRHAYFAGARIVKRNVMMWDRFDTRSFSATWTATLGGREIAKGEARTDLVSNVPAFLPIEFVAPDVKAKAAGEIVVVYRDAGGSEVARDSFAFEIHPKTEPPAAPEGDGVRVIAPYALKSPAEIPWAAVSNGLKLVVFSQGTAFYKALGFDVEDVAPRNLYLRDFASKAIASLDESDLRDWAGQPLTDQKRKYEFEAFGHLSDKGGHGPRWNYQNALGGLVIRTPDVVGFLPIIEGEFDGNYSGALRQYVGKGEIVWTTLSPFGRTGMNEEKGAPIRDAAAERVARALFDDVRTDFAGRTRAVAADGACARRIVSELAAKPSSAPVNGAAAGDVLLLGADAALSGRQVLACAQRGANVLVIGNDRLARELGLVFAEGEKAKRKAYFVRHTKDNADLRAIGANLLHFRDAYDYTPFAKGEGWRIDAEGLFASKTLANGARLFVTGYGPFRLFDRISNEQVRASSKDLDLEEDEEDELKHKERAAEDAKKRQRILTLCDLSFERGRQFAARLLTELGAEASVSKKLYGGLMSDVDPYAFGYW